MKYKIQVLVKSSQSKNDQWRDVKPSFSTQCYLFDDEVEAEKMRQMCYGSPEHDGKSRVVTEDVMEDKR